MLFRESQETRTFCEQNSELLMLTHIVHSAYSVDNVKTLNESFMHGMLY
jgi:hypothetical protein